MARIRNFACYRTVERPFTRKSKYSKKNFVKVVPASKIQRFQTGDASRVFKYQFLIKSTAKIQVRHNALESARLTANKVMEKMLGKDGFFIKMRVFPHHILRENPLASGAGADRMSTGMAHSYGKNISSAAQLKVGQSIFEIDVDDNGLKAGKLAMHRMTYKFPCRCMVEAYNKQTGKQVFV